MGVSASARKTPQVSQCAKNRGFRYSKKCPPSFAMREKPRFPILKKMPSEFHDAQKSEVSDTQKIALRSFANSSNPQIDTLQFPNPQKCLPKSPKVTKRPPKFPYTPQSRGFLAPLMRPHPRPTPDHSPKSSPSRHRAVKSAV